MKILVTGASGQLGRKIQELLSEHFKLKLTDKENLDITDDAKVNKVIKSEKPDVIIHAAAYTQVDKAEEDKLLCRRINSDGTKNIAKAAQRINAILIYISTDYVFDGKKKKPYTENDIARPLSVYGKTKLNGEKHIQRICKRYYIIRSSWIFGELPKNYLGTNFVEKIISLSKEKDCLSVVNDQIGSPTYTKDLVDIIKKIIANKIPYGTYHVSGAGQCSWYEFAKEIFRLKKIKVPIKPISSAQFPQKAKRPQFSYLDKAKIEQLLNIRIRTWQEMLKNYLLF